MKTFYRISQAALLAAFVLVGFGPQGAHAQAVRGAYTGATAGTPAQSCPPQTVAQYDRYPRPYTAAPQDTVAEPLPIPRIVNGQVINATVPFAYGSANMPYGYPDIYGRVPSPYGNPQGLQVYSRSAVAVPGPPPNPNVYPYFQGPAGTAASYPATGVTANPQSAAELIQYYQTHPNH